MKRLLFILVCSLVFCASYSQGLGEPLKKDITQFMGIPIDGSVSLMTDRLKDKGFVPFDEGLFGLFNGENVLINMNEYKGKVWRVFVVFPLMDSYSVKSKYNTLSQEFQSKSNYIKIENEATYYIDNNTNLSYSMNIENKRFVANFLQLGGNVNYNKLSEIELKKHLSKKLIWFYISDEGENQYRIVLYYENLYNFSNGDDL